MTLGLSAMANSLVRVQARPGKTTSRPGSENAMRATETREKLTYVQPRPGNCTYLAR
jgi:hypothetical protein